MISSTMRFKVADVLSLYGAVSLIVFSCRWLGMKIYNTLLEGPSVASEILDAALHNLFIPGCQNVDMASLKNRTSVARRSHQNQKSPICIVVWNSVFMHIFVEIRPAVLVRLMLQADRQLHTDRQTDRSVFYWYRNMVYICCAQSADLDNPGIARCNSWIACTNHGLAIQTMHT